MNVWIASHRESTTGTFFARNSSKYKNPATPITHQWLRTSRSPGNCTNRKRCNSPRVKTVA